MTTIKINEKEVIELKPVTEGMTYDQNCWVMINTRSSDACEIIFFNPSQKMDTDFEEVEKLSEFAESMFDNEFSISSDDDVETEINENKCTKSGCDVTEHEDYDEESCWKYLSASGQIIDIYKNKSLDELVELVKEAKKDLNFLEEAAKDNMADTQSFQKDPYAYYGVSRSDFY